MSFNASQRAVLATVRGLNFRRTPQGVRVRGVHRNGAKIECDPVCAAANVKVGSVDWYYQIAEPAAICRLSFKSGCLIADAADNPFDQNHDELCRLLDVPA